MTDKSKRRERRIQKNLRKVKAREYLLRIGSNASPRNVGLYGKTRRLCSCMLCSNSRKWFGKPIKEKVYLEFEQQCNNMIIK